MSALFNVAVDTIKSAEKSGHSKAYLARLRPGPRGAIDRVFARKVPEIKGNRRVFAMPAHPGEVFEARRWWWAGDRYDGGSVWFGIDAEGTVVELSREEAFASVLAVRIDTAPVADTVPAMERPKRFAPAGVSTARLPAPAALT